MSYYDSDGDCPRSPGLQVRRVKATPSPSPPPFIPRVVEERRTPTANTAFLRNGKRVRKGRTKPSLGDKVLVSYMGSGNQPDIARLAGEEALNSASDESEGETIGPRDRMEVDKPVDVPPLDHESTTDPKLLATAQAALAQVAIGMLNASTNSVHHESQPDPLQNGDLDPSHGNIEMPIRSESDHRGLVAPFTELPLNRPDVKREDDRIGSGTANGHNLQNGSIQSGNDQKLTTREAYAEDDSIATSPIGQLTISQDQGSPGQRLPALQHPASPSRDGASGSPTQDRSLPSFRHLEKLAEAANQESEVRANGFHQPHRQSFSSSGGGPSHSPTFVNRPYPNGHQWSPPQYPSLNHTSSVTGHSEISAHDAYYKGLSSPSATTTSNPYYYHHRRQSQASENGPPYPPPSLPSTSTTESYASTDGCSASTQPTPIEIHHRMSFDGIGPPILPPPHVSIQHVPPHGMGGFKCDYPGCTAPPFQTQYLLNSHANVHSQNRPHYCPVPGCPRGEGGKGFKRKNEMIRHGLVHDSPGYVCPFCPDREHKYPRPDNLQRHVRVHHVDKDKDDPLLREVLAQRPEGGNRGRRRRLGG